MTSLKTSIKTITYLSDIGCLEIQGASLVNQFTSILFMMFYGIVQDKLGLKKPLIWCMSFILVLTGPFMIYVY